MKISLKICFLAMAILLIAPDIKWKQCDNNGRFEQAMCNDAAEPYRCPLNTGQKHESRSTNQRSRLTYLFTTIIGAQAEVWSL